MYKIYEFKDRCDRVYRPDWIQYIIIEGDNWNVIGMIEYNGSVRIDDYYITRNKWVKDLERIDWTWIYVKSYDTKVDLIIDYPELIMS